MNQHKLQSDFISSYSMLIETKDPERLQWCKQDTSLAANQFIQGAEGDFAFEPALKIARTFLIENESGVFVVPEVKLTEKGKEIFGETFTSSKPTMTKPEYRALVIKTLGHQPDEEKLVYAMKRTCWHMRKVNGGELDYNEKYIPFTLTFLQ